MFTFQIKSEENTKISMTCFMGNYVFVGLVSFVWGSVLLCFVLCLEEGEVMC